MSRWCTVDRVTELEPGKGAKGLRNVPNTLAILDSHFPRFPVLPGILIMGSLAELAGRLLQEQTGRAWRMARAEQVRFRHFIQPGDQMELSVEVVDRTDGEVTLSAKVHVGGKLATRVGARRLREAS